MQPFFASPPPPPPNHAVLGLVLESCFGEPGFRLLGGMDMFSCNGTYNYPSLLVFPG